MTDTQKKYPRPRITLTETDADRLTSLAAAWANRQPEIAEALSTELDRAKVVADAKVSDDVIRMGSTARYEVAGGEIREVTLVYPVDADIAQGKVSVMTPVGTALLGLSAGQEVSWKARDGKVHGLKVLSVTQEAGVSAPALAEA